MNFSKSLKSSPSRKRRPGALPAKNASLLDFEEIQRFVEEHGHAPQHGEDRDIFERLYAVRLDRLRALEEADRFSRRSITKDC